MKYFLRLLIVFGVFFLLATKTFATSYIFPVIIKNYSVQILCSDSSCTITTTWFSNTEESKQRVELWKTKDSNGKLKDKVFGKDYNFTKTGSATKYTDTIKNLSRGTTYYLYTANILYNPYRDPQTFEIKTDADASDYAITLSQHDGKTFAIFSTPVGDQNNFFIDILRGSTSVFQTSLGKIQGTSSANGYHGTGTVDLGDLTTNIGEGTYTANLTALKNGTQTILASTPVNLYKSTLISGDATKTGIDYQWPLDYSKATETPVVLQGKINKTENPDLSVFQITVEVNVNSDFSGESRLGTVALQPDGTYTATFSDLNPSTTYYVRHRIGTKGGEVAERIDSFNSTRGHFTAGTSEARADEDNRSYKLLSPLPGLGVLFDPDLCAEKVAQGQKVFGGTCDNQVNAFINYLFEMLIGLAAVVLVIKIIINGYQYIMTDVPFLRASLKNTLGTSILGLLVVLSSFLILNTINPKIVENTININPVLVGVTPKTTLSEATFEKIVGRKPTPKPELEAIVKQVAVEKNIDACIIESIIQQESPNWDEKEIGCDEDAARSDVPSRVAFIQSGITLTGKTVLTTAITDGSVRNDNFTPDHKFCYFDDSKPGYNLDWRFSKGLGLSQQTIFPKYYGTNQYGTAVKQGGELWDNRSIVPTAQIKDLLQYPKKQIEYIVDHYRENASRPSSCLNNLEQSFKAYNGGNCATDNKSAINYGKSVMAIYNACKEGK